MKKDSVYSEIPSEVTAGPVRKARCSLERLRNSGRVTSMFRIDGFGEYPRRSELIDLIEQGVEALGWSSVDIERARPQFEGRSRLLLGLCALARLGGAPDSKALHLACRSSGIFREFCRGQVPSTVELQRFLCCHSGAVDLVVAKVVGRVQAISWRRVDSSS